MTVNHLKNFVSGLLKIEIHNLAVKEILVEAKLKCSNLITTIISLCFTVICVCEAICLYGICVVKTLRNAPCASARHGTSGDVTQVAEVSPGGRTAARGAAECCESGRPPRAPPHSCSRGHQPHHRACVFVKGACQALF